MNVPLRLCDILHLQPMFTQSCVYRKNKIMLLCAIVNACPLCAPPYTDKSDLVLDRIYPSFNAKMSCEAYIVREI